MYVQVVTYGLSMSESEYLDIADELAPQFAGMPGLQAKLWLEDLDLGRYGAVYFWEDRESMERFLRSDLFEGTNPDFLEVESEGFGILENLTAQTQPVIEVVETRRAALARRTAPTPAPAKRAAPKKAASKAVAPEKAAPKKAVVKKTAKKTTG